jgi:putative ABC transport system permease protein
MRWDLILRLAAADWRRGLKGFRIFLACIAVGVAALAAAGSAGQAFREGLAGKSRAILGGDALVDARQQALPAQTLAWLTARARVAVTVEANAMADANGVRRLADVKAIDGVHPLQGAIEATDAIGRPAAAQALLRRGPDGLWGALAEPLFLDTFKVRPGDVVILAGGAVRITGTLVSEPDALGAGFNFSPRIMIATGALPALDLARPGSLFETNYHLAVADPSSAALDDLRRALNREYPEVARRWRDIRNASPQLKDTIARLEMFLSFVGLAALLAGGLGVAGAVRGYVEARRGEIATLKALGASSGEIRALLGLQIAGLAALGAGVGALSGAAVPLAAFALLKDQLPVPAAPAVYPAPVLAAAFLGLVAGLGFALGPIGQARVTPVSALYRGAAGQVRTPWAERLAGGVLLAGLGAAAALTSPEPAFAGILTGAAFAAFGLLWLMGRGVQRAAMALRPHARGRLAVAMAGLGGPASVAPTVGPAVGLGIALLVALTQVQANLVAQVGEIAPRQAPSVAFVEIPAAGAPEFDRVVQAAVGSLTPDRYLRAPVLTARMAAINGAQVDRNKVTPGERWLVEGDLATTYLDRLPSGQSVTAGAWWPPGYTGPLLVSLEEKAAEGAGLSVGTRIVFDIAGRQVEATVANLRRVDWGSFGPTFALLFSPGTLEPATTRYAAIARFTPAEERAAVRAVAAPFPMVGVIRVRDALAAASDLLGQLSAAIQSIAAVAFIAGAFAVAGALAAGARRRAYEGAILKTLGATRGDVLVVFALEQGLAGLAAAAIGACLGMAAAYPLIVVVFEATWVPQWGLVLGAASGAVVALALAGVVAGWFALSRAPARVLKDDGAG